MVRRIVFKTKIFSSVLILVSAGAVAFAAKKDQGKGWSSEIPKVAAKPTDWVALIGQLKKSHMYFGALASAHRMLSFFPDIESKEAAYRTIVELVDLGYPFSTKKLFVAGDLEPQTKDQFAESYFVYKGMLNREKRVDKWADYFFSKIEQEASPKFMFFEAVQLYEKKELVPAIKKLEKVLEITKGSENLPFIKKAARTLARIHYELEEYEKSLDVYESFLLRLNPVTPTDWMEASWNLYRLKKYDKALGFIYNLEASSAKRQVLLEKYILRALIYREHCSTEHTHALADSFEKEFGIVIKGIRLGEPLRRFSILRKLHHADTEEYQQIAITIRELAKERKEIEELPDEFQAIANYLYQTEIRMLQKKRGFYQDRALNVLAEHLVILGESLKFLKFDVEREKYSPERVFMVDAPKPLIEDVGDKSFRLRWIQKGDFWRDERLKYTALVKNHCDEF